MKIYTICLEFSGSTDFINDYYIHTGNQIAFAYNNNQVWYLQNEKSEDTLNSNNI